MVERAICTSWRAKMLLQAVQRQMIAQFADNHVGQQARPGQTLGNRGGGRQRLGRIGAAVPVGLAEGDLDVRLAVARVAPLRTGLAGILGADVLEDFEAGRVVFELFGDFLADAAAFQSATGAKLLLGLEVMFDGNPRQRLGQLRPAVLVLDAAGCQLLAGFGFHRRLVHRQRIQHQSKEQQLRRIEAFGLGAVEPAEQRLDLGLVLLLQGFNGVGGFLLDLLAGGPLLGDLLIAQRRLPPRTAGVRWPAVA